MSYRAPKGASVHDYEITDFVKLPGTFTFATLPINTTLAAGLTAYCSDLNGGAGGKAYYTGTAWVPFLSSAGGITSTGGTLTATTANGVTNLDVTPGVFSKILFSWGVPIFSPSSCTMGANGVFTAMTALPVTFATGVWMAVPAGYINAAQLAGVFWCVMSSTTAGTFFNNTLAAGTIPNTASIPASPIAFAAVAGTGTQVTSNQALFSVSIPGGSMGSNGALRYITAAFLNNNANGKSIITTFGGTTVQSAASASTAFAPYTRTIRNVNSQAVQMGINIAAVTDLANSASAIFTGTINTANAQTLAFTVTLSSATDWVGYVGGTIELLYAP